MRTQIELENAPRTRSPRRDPAADENVALCIEIGDTRLLLPAELVAGVVSAPHPTTIPGAPPWLPGVIHHGDSAAAIIDLHSLFGSPDLTTASPYAAMLRHHDGFHAIACTRVHGFEALIDTTATTLDQRHGLGNASNTHWSQRLEAVATRTVSPTGSACFVLDAQRFAALVDARLQNHLQAPATSGTQGIHDD